jgi:hypothetical protein
MKKKNILFTFDYELFLGKKSGSVSRCVLEPTQKLLAMFSEYKISSAIFFVDTTWLIRLKEVAYNNPAAKKDYEKVVEQLQEIVNRGHYVFPHLHPHWINASYLSEINQWQLINYSRYRFHSLDNTEREELFDKSIGILREIFGYSYLPSAYRAGGWSIQPFEDFEPFFQRYGIKYDFSVLPGSKWISSGQHYDFSDIETTTPYSFSTDVTVQGKGSYVEFPISMLKFSAVLLLLNRVLLKYLYLTGNHSYGDGNGIAAEIIEHIDVKGEMVAIELMSKIKLKGYLNFLRKNNYMQFIAHPKMLSSHNLKTFSRFLEKGLKKYKLETDFKRML